MFSDIASGATLVLFVIYFIGRIITIVIEKEMQYDEISYEKMKYGFSKSYDIVDQLTITEPDPNEENYNCVVLTSKQGIRNIKIYSLEYDYENLEQKPKQGQLIGEYKFLNIGQSYAIYVNVNEMFAAHRIVYETHDLKQVTFDIVDKDMVNGVASFLSQPKHTWKSRMYYMFR